MMIVVLKYTIIHFVQIVQTAAIKFEIAKIIKFSLTRCLNCVGSVLNVHKRTKDRQTIDVLPTYVRATYTKKNLVKISLCRHTYVYCST